MNPTLCKIKIKKSQTGAEDEYVVFANHAEPPHIYDHAKPIKIDESFFLASNLPGNFKDWSFFSLVGDCNSIVSVYCADHSFIIIQNVDKAPKTTHQKITYLYPDEFFMMCEIEKSINLGFCQLDERKMTLKLCFDNLPDALWLLGADHANMQFLSWSWFARNFFFRCHLGDRAISGHEIDLESIYVFHNISSRRALETLRAQCTTNAMQRISLFNSIEEIESKLLSEAVREDDATDVSKLLGRYNNMSVTSKLVNAKDCDGSYPLHIACANGNLDIVKLLLEHKAFMGVQDGHGRLPVHLAVMGNHVDVLKYLLKERAPLNGLDNDGLAAYHLAAKMGHDKCVQIFLDDPNCDHNIKDQEGNTALQLLITPKNSSSEKMARLLVSSGKMNLASCNKYSSNVLHLAAINNDINMVKLVLSGKLNIREVVSEDSNGKTPLELAQQHGHSEIVGLLTQHVRTSHSEIEDLSRLFRKLMPVFHPDSHQDMNNLFGLNNNRQTLERNNNSYAVLFGLAVDTMTLSACEQRVDDQFALHSENGGPSTITSTYFSETWMDCSSTNLNHSLSNDEPNLEQQFNIVGDENSLGALIDLGHISIMSLEDTCNPVTDPAVPSLLSAPITLPQQYQTEEIQQEARNVLMASLGNPREASMSDSDGYSKIEKQKDTSHQILERDCEPAAACKLQENRAYAIHSENVPVQLANGAFLVLYSKHKATFTVSSKQQWEALVAFYQDWFSKNGESTINFTDVKPPLPSLPHVQVEEVDVPGAGSLGTPISSGASISYLDGWKLEVKLDLQRKIVSTIAVDKDGCRYSKQKNRRDSYQCTSNTLSLASGKEKRCLSKVEEKQTPQGTFTFTMIREHDVHNHRRPAVIANAQPAAHELQTKRRRLD